MGLSKQEWIAATQGPQYTIYAACIALNLPLTARQEEFQRYLEEKYGEKEVVPFEEGEKLKGS